MQIELGDEAGRVAYLVAFHAAQALIHERTGREAKTHRGVRNQFLLLTKDDARVAPGLRRFLSRAYDLKSLADYATGPEAYVPLEQAASAIEIARQFLNCVEALIDPPQGLASTPPVLPS